MPDPAVRAVSEAEHERRDEVYEISALIKSF
jgi:hypothetical protein